MLFFSADNTHIISIICYNYLYKEISLEVVDGISRLTEVMYIERDADGKIFKVYDVDKNEVDKTMLYKSFMIRVEEHGFYYKDEFIPMANILDTMKKRALGYQRRRKGHSFNSIC